MNFHFGSWNPNGLLNFQRAIVGVNSHWIEEFFILLENYWNLDVLNGLAWPIWTFETQVFSSRESNWQFDSRPLKVGNRLISSCVGDVRHIVGKFLDKGYNFSLDFISIGGLHTKLWAPNSWESELWEFQDSHLGVPGQNAICMWALWRGT
jgi:hypothetical protein